MGRGRRVGLDYFDFDTIMDTKVELLEAEFGIKAFAVFVKLLQRIYGEFGYYCEWGDEVELLFSSKIGEGRNFVSEVVQASIRRGIFDSSLFEQFGILTSRGIQKRYFNAAKRRDKIEVINEYLLINVDQNSINVNINPISVNINSKNVNRNEQSRVEKSRVEKSRVEKDTHAHDMYFSNLEINSLFLEYLEMRKKVKVPNTERAITLLVNKLEKHDDDDIKKQMLENAIVGGWKSVYPLDKKNDSKKSTGDFDEFLQEEQEKANWIDGAEVLGID